MHRFFTIRQRFVRRLPGQSIVVIAFMLVVMIGFVGLSVDVGNAYGQQRRVQSGVNAAAVAGMLSVQDNTTNSAVLTSIKAAMQGHGFNLGDTAHYNWTAYYIVPDVAHPGFMTAKNISTAYPGSAAPPNNIQNVAVKATATVDSYFAKVVGRPNLPAHAAGYACNAAATNIYPISVPFSPGNSEIQYAPNSWNPATQTGTQIANTHVWTPGSIFAILNDQSAPGIHVGYWRFNTGNTPNANTLKQQMGAPGVFHQGANCSDQNCYIEEAIQNPQPISPPATSGYSAATQQNGKIEPYDFITGVPGNKAVVLNQPETQAHITSGDTMILPMTAGGGGKGANSWMQIQQLGSFRLLSSAGSENGGLVLQYIGPVQAAVQSIARPVTRPVFIRRKNL